MIKTDDGVKYYPCYLSKALDENQLTLTGYKTKDGKRAFNLVSNVDSLVWVNFEAEDSNDSFSDWYVQYMIPAIQAIKEALKLRA